MSWSPLPSELPSDDLTPPGSAPSIRLSGVGVRRDDIPVLSDVDLILDDHRIAIIGANGSGKSTLVRLLNALVLPTVGQVTVDGESTAKAARRIRRRIGFVFQNPDNQVVMPIVADDLAFGCRNIGIPRAEIGDRVRQILDALGLGRLHDRETHTLSGGERQLVALAAVLIMEPSVIIFDEPTTMLDLRNRRRLQEHIDRLPQRAIMVSHDLDLVQSYPRVIVLDQGRVSYDGAPEAAIAHYRELSR
ncbi:energy-coupling factor ABC transporter ATP-binding protein [Microlunatus soli]|uniref:Biotin transport system ATP-binding protein n=1 Tax=Microlunatus soli TaxID=630515 RepID=A0A1H1Z2Q5_9ACTN|nr:ABC transporter ATP-binding protein [Microlunatus soli]SDT28085.1 biotin transport system ATP-binding protein [Microlunatus soli]